MTVPTAKKLLADLDLDPLTATDAFPGNPVSFSNPPVAEVALAVQFDGAVTDDTVTLGHFWPKIQASFPRLEPQMPLPPVTEQFGAQGPPAITFELMSAAPAGRYWLISANDHELVQVQPDRFGFNWRKDPGEANYPRYRYIREQFDGLYSAFEDAASSQGRRITPSWCEVTYINPIEVGSEGFLPDLSTVLNRFSSAHLTRLGPPEDTTFSERYVLMRGDVPFGRFHVSVTPAVRNSDGARLFVLNLTARGLARTPDHVGVMEFLDYGRDLIVNTFRDLTTPEYHEKWGLDDAG